MADDFDDDLDACSILVPVDVLGTPGVLQSVTTGEGAFSRASIGTYYDSNGVLQTAAANVKRVTYNPANLMQEPYDLLESAATNTVRNNTMQGASAGSPGSTPTFWGIEGNGTNGLTRTVVQVGVEDGIEFMEIRYAGTATANGTHQIGFESTTSTPAATGEKWGASLFVAAVGNAIGAINPRMQISERTAAGAQIGVGEISIPFIQRRLSASRVTLVHTMAQPDVGRISHKLIFSYTNGSAVDVTLRLGLPQLELNQVTSPIRTSDGSGTRTRAADVIGPAPALAEDNNPLWASGTTYAADMLVYKGNRVYASTGKAGNTNKDPVLPINQFNPDGTANFWVDIGPTNRSAMFDGLISSQTSAASPLRITLTPGAFNGFALFGIDADTYEVVVKDAPGGDVIYSEPVTALEGSMPGDYYEYFFDRFKPLTQFSRFGIEPYGTAEITLTLRKATGDVKLGMFAIGDLRPTGIPQRDAVVSPGTFTYFKQDAYGNATIRKRPNATNMTISCVFPIEEANLIKAMIDEVSATPVVVVGSQAELYEWLTTFGIVTADISPVPYPDCTIKLSVKGFI